MNTVDKLNKSEKVPWILMKDIEHTVYKKIEKKLKFTYIDKKIGKMPYIIDSAKLREKLATNHKLIHLVKEEVEGISSYLSDHYMFVLTDMEGTALYVAYNQQVASKKSNIEVVPGVSFSLIHAGVNAISVATEVHSTVVVSGGEHDLDLFKSWSCVCSPICMDGRPVGYMDLSVHVGKDISFAIPLLHRLVSAVEKSLTMVTPSQEGQTVKLFKHHGLTKREMEVAMQWIQNHSVPKISYSLGITEGTVRNMLKKIYSKTNVSNKGDFFRKFLH